MTESHTTNILPEEWRPVPGYEGVYDVSDHGRVRSRDREVIYSSGVVRTHRGKILKPKISSNGYRQVGLWKDRKVRWHGVHRLVSSAFIGDCPTGFHVCHEDGDRANNHAANLRIASPKENNADKVKHGTSPRDLVRLGIHHEAVKTHCPRGHVLSSPNLVLCALRRGKRSCLACSRARNYVRKHPGLEENFKEVADSYFWEILKD